MDKDLSEAVKLATGLEQRRQREQVILWNPCFFSLGLVNPYFVKHNGAVYILLVRHAVIFLDSL